MFLTLCSSEMKCFRSLNSHISCRVWEMSYVQATAFCLESLQHKVHSVTSLCYCFVQEIYLLILLAGHKAVEFCGHSALLASTRRNDCCLTRQVVSSLHKSFVMMGYFTESVLFIFQGQLFNFKETSHNLQEMSITFNNSY
jgi:hypothetical protein